MCAKNRIGILAFGSLIKNPGSEICHLVTDRIKTQTPFKVEYARLSTSSRRGGAPTLVPVKHGGGKVNSEILVLGIKLLQRAKNLLYKREIGKIGSNKVYNEPSNPGKNNVLVKEWKNLEGIDSIIYTDFPDKGKLSSPTAEKLCEAAIKSLGKADEGQDGISYLKNAIDSGVITPLTNSYKRAILEKTNSKSLSEAMDKIRN